MGPNCLPEHRLRNGARTGTKATMSDSLHNSGQLGVIVEGAAGSRPAGDTDPGHGTPAITGHREAPWRAGSERALPSSASSQVDAPPRRLSLPVTLVTRTGSRYRLVAGGPSDGIIVRCPGSAVPAPHARLVLGTDEPGLENVQVVLQVLGPVSSSRTGSSSLGTHAVGGDPVFEGDAIAVRWLTLTATKQRAQLVAALKRMLGVEARVCIREDALGTHRKLVYNPARRQVSLVTVGAQAMPKSRRENTPPPSVLTGRLTPTPLPGELPRLGEIVGLGAGPGASRREKRATRPFVLVDNRALTDVSRTLLDRGTFKPASSSQEAGSTVPQKTMLAPTQNAFERVPTGDLAAPGPVVRRSRARGCYTVGGQLRGMTCGWIGRTHLAFDTGAGADLGLHDGDVVSIGVPGGPLSPNVVWVVGEVCRIEGRSDGTSVVELDLRRTRRLPAVYESLVAFWESQSDASSS